MDPLADDSNETRPPGGTPKPERSAPPAYINMGTLLGLGAALGILFGLLIDNMLLGMAIGVALGVLFGAIVESNRPKQ